MPSSTATNPRLLRCSRVQWYGGREITKMFLPDPVIHLCLLCFKLRPFVINLITDQLIVYIYTRGSADLRSYTDRVMTTV